MIGKSIEAAPVSEAGGDAVSAAVDDRSSLEAAQMDNRGNTFSSHIHRLQQEVETLKAALSATETKYTEESTRRRQVEDDQRIIQNTLCLAQRELRRLSEGNTSLCSRVRRLIRKQGNSDREVRRALSILLNCYRANQQLNTPSMQNKEGQGEF